MMSEEVTGGDGRRDTSKGRGGVPGVAPCQRMERILGGDLGEQWLVMVGPIGVV